MIFKDSLGNTYTKLPKPKPTKGAKGTKVGPKHGRRTKYLGPKKKHGTLTGRNGHASRVHYYGEPQARTEMLGGIARH